MNLVVIGVGQGRSRKREGDDLNDVNIVLVYKNLILI